MILLSFLVIALYAWLFIMLIKFAVFFEGALCGLLAGVYLFDYHNWHPVYAIIIGTLITIINYSIQYTKIGALILTLAFTTAYCYIPWHIFTSKPDSDHTWMWFWITIVALVSLTLHAYTFTRRHEKQTAQTSQPYQSL